MPELPEVETICNSLRQGRAEIPSLIGKKISAAQISWSRSIAQPAPEVFQGRIVGQVFQGIIRRGKYLVFSLDKDYLLVHLRMSGDLLVEPGDTPPDKYQRVAFILVDEDGGEDGLRLAFNDARKFGRIWLVDDPQQVVGALGPEPLDAAFGPENLYQGLQAHRRQLKPLLLDQSFLAGLGNIYTDEALHMTGLHPQLRSHCVTWEQSQRLWTNIRHVLNEGIRRNGASIDWVYRGGDFQNYFRVYRRTGEPCPVCKTPIERIVVGQRGTHYCPTCQPHEGAC